VRLVELRACVAVRRDVLSEQLRLRQRVQVLVGKGSLWGDFLAI
jgi:hypothetical protein